MGIYDTVGRIFDIQRYSIHDGPGIRTIVFFKGCILRCRWCCNPESQEWEIQQMMRDGKMQTVGRDVTVREVMEEIEKDFPYYYRSGGGVTLSGGEALCQPDFAEALLKACHDDGINTAIETTGFAEKEVLDRIIPLIDYVLMDIKHTDGKKHEAFTGKSNEKILENARYIAGIAKDMTVRVPVIPTFNDTEREIRDIAKFAATLPNVTKINLLPYHRLGRDKYTGLSREYSLDNIEPMPKEKINTLLEAARESGLLVSVGG
ncbi:MAG: glycyl-radical enzyme activating protein [Eubacteriales bacterium]